MDTKTLILIALAVLIAAYLYFLERRQKKDPFAALKARYETLSAEDVKALPETEAVRAVAANLLCKQGKDSPDLSMLLPLLSAGRCGVYSVWVIVNETEKADLARVFKSPSRRYVELAAAGLVMIGAPDCAAMLSDAWNAYAEAKENGNKAPDLSNQTAAFRKAVASEQPLTLCARYILDNPEQFADGTDLQSDIE